MRAHSHSVPWSTVSLATSRSISRSWSVSPMGKASPFLRLAVSIGKLRPEVPRVKLEAEGILGEDLWLWSLLSLAIKGSLGLVPRQSAGTVPALCTGLSLMYWKLRADTSLVASYCSSVCFHQVCANELKVQAELKQNPNCSMRLIKPSVILISTAVLPRAKRGTSNI